MRPFKAVRLTAVLVLVAALTSCYSFIGRYGPPFYDGPDSHYFERLVGRSFRLESLGSDFTAEPAPDEALQVQGGSEFLPHKFIYIANKLQIPWLNLIGNHDISIFGNYKERLGYTRQAGVSFYPVGSQSNFLLMHAYDSCFYF